MKRLRYQNGTIDAIDIEIVRALSADGRMTMAELARRIGLSPPSTTERVRRLEEAGVIEGYAAQVNPVALGLPVAAYIRVRPVPGQMHRAAEVLRGLDAVVECDRVTGEDCFVARVHVRSIEGLESIIDAIVPFATTNSSIIQSSPVKRRLPALPEPAM